ncbi:MAG: cyclic nucleotide-binding domain-containing protein [Leptospiraceae bacterium]|nr:cyclic nucleotide-binding domain-containing protein [Leptospiraceae bacterium]MDW7976003.1 cyclic nucleotide-binding domain-containing protein [Leptospiraceae bacterium]
MEKEKQEWDLLKLGLEGEQAITNELFFKFGRTYEPKQVILKEGDKGKDVYLILSGRVVVAEKLASSNQYKVLTTLGPGEIFGEMAMFDDQPRSATLVAIEHCKILVLSPENFERIFRTHPRWALKIVAALCKRIQNAFEQIDSYYRGSNKT